MGSGQSITATEQIAVGDNDRSAIGLTGALNQTGGSVITLGSAPIYIGNRGADGAYNISGGTLSIGGRMYISNPAYASSDGTLTIIGADATITMDVLDARTNSTIRFVFNDDRGVSTIDAASWAKIAETATLEIVMEAGVAINNGDVFTLIDGGANLVGQFGNYTDGDIIKFNGLDTFRVNYDVGNNNLLTLMTLRTIPSGTIIIIK